MSEIAKITYIPTARDFITAGNATLTFVSVQTGSRFTYRTRKSDRDTLWFVDLLTGSDNESDYQFIGVISMRTDHRYPIWAFKHSAKSTVSAEAKSVRAIDYLVALLNYDREFPTKVEFWHSGQCGRCGRKLTDPESIDRGLGPKCAAKAS